MTDPHLSTHLHPSARTILEATGRDDLLGHMIAHGRLPDDADVSAELVAVLATATQIPPSGHLAMAAAVQACVDDAVSKTVNLPTTASVHEVYTTYLTAWEAGCRGITVYIDGSRAVQPKAL